MERADEDAVALGIETREEDGRIDVVLTGELDLVGRQPLLDRFAMLPVEGREVAIDLSGLAFMDSTGCRALLELGAAARSRGVSGYGVVASTAGPVARLLELTGLAEAVPIRWTASP